ncbi:MAG TPA: PIN domain-containing protein [Candidatus Binataceae bacterium]|nr:PIN domain-containing protein [Candidatus Binataceae bacterium]
MAADPEVADRGLLDTSIFIARESGRPLGALPEAAAISVVTIAELHLGVLMASGAATRARRLRTLTSVQNMFDPLLIDSGVARAFAEIVAEARRKGWRPKIMDTWIAATAIANDLPVYTQDADFLVIPGVRVTRV